ncbi:MAG: hypothetical protein GVY06_04045 [Alphaproteobacteria bacterium]|nr:hypothetical protein [Alphaproteobacteria bacterium]
MGDWKGEDSRVLKRWITGLVTLVIAMSPGGPAAIAAADSPRALEEIHREWAEDEELQLERPEAKPQVNTPPTPRERPGWQRWIADMLGWLFSIVGPVFRVIFYILVSAIAVTIAGFILSQVFNLRVGRERRDKARVTESRVEDLRPDAGRARTLLEEADALAREGRFADAVHLLLFRSIEDIQERQEGGLPRSLTAREIGALGALPETARRALAPIIGVVERSFFGGREVDRQGWETARASYETFAFGESWS